MQCIPKSFTYSTRRGIVYARVESRPLKMTLYVPNDGDLRARPGMVLIHGGAWFAGTRYQQAWYCRQFARSGYVVMTIDYRLMPRHAFPKCLHDSKAAVRWLRLHAADYRIDPERIVAFGASAGGHLAAFLGTTFPEDGLEGTENPGATSEVRAVISLYGAVDLTCYRDSPLHGPLSRLTRRFLSEFSGREGFALDSLSWEAASPITYIRPATRPMLFAHGQRDHLVHFEQSRRFYQRLCDLGIPSRLIALPNREHGFDYVHFRERHRIFLEMLSFLNQHALSDPVPVPASDPSAGEEAVAAGPEAKAAPEE